MWYFKKQAILLIALVSSCIMGGCSEFILEPRITFEISLDRKKLEEDNQVELTLHSFNLEISSLEVITLRYGDEEIENFVVTKEERFNQLIVEFPLPDSTESATQVLVGVDELFHQAGFAVYELP